MKTISTTPIEIRPALFDSDIEQIVNLYKKIFREEIPQYNIPEHPVYTNAAEDYLKQLLFHPNNSCLVLVQNNTVCGTIVYSTNYIHPVLLQKECFIWDFFVDPSIRGTRAAFKLWKKMEWSAKKNNCIRLRGVSSSPLMVDLCRRQNSRIDAYMIAKEL